MQRDKHNRNTAHLSCGLVVLNYIGYETTCRLIDAVKDFPELEHIVIVDNKSPNDSYERLKKYQNSKISVIQSEKNGGYSYGNNFGIRYLLKNYNPDIIGIANPDVMFDNNLLRRIKQIFAANNDYAVLTGLQLKPDGTIGTHPFWEDKNTAKSMIIQLIHQAFVAPVKHLAKKILHIRLRKAAVDLDLYEDYINGIKNSPESLNQVYAVEGSLFFIRANDFKAVGLFDEKIFLFYEEDVLAAKIKKLGRKTGVLNDITYTHFHVYNEDAQKLFELTALEKGRIFYFNNYISKNKALQIVHVLLVSVVHFEQILFNWLRKKIFHSLKC